MELNHNGGLHLANNGDTNVAELTSPWPGPTSPTSEFPGVSGGPRLQHTADMHDQYLAGNYYIIFLFIVKSYRNST